MISNVYKAVFLLNVKTHYQLMNSKFHVFVGSPNKFDIAQLLSWRHIGYEMKDGL